MVTAFLYIIYVKDLEKKHAKVLREPLSNIVHYWKLTKLPKIRGIQVEFTLYSSSENRLQSYSKQSKSVQTLRNERSLYESVSNVIVVLLLQVYRHLRC